MELYSNDDRSYQSLGDSERAILAAASRFIAAWLQNGTLTEANAEALTDKAIKLAIQLADKVDDAIKTDSEL
ncbi:MAG TPA: hypothetical protein VIM96_05780 [Pseudomonadales bacterium]|jgi:hypothetical protein